jgi:hypothetical protein
LTPELLPIVSQSHEVHLWLRAISQDGVKHINSPSARFWGEGRKSMYGSFHPQNGSNHSFGLNNALAGIIKSEFNPKENNTVVIKKRSVA